MRGETIRLPPSIVVLLSFPPLSSSLDPLSNPVQLFAYICCRLVLLVLYLQSPRDPLPCRDEKGTGRPRARNRTSTAGLPTRGSAVLRTRPQQQEQQHQQRQGPQERERKRHRERQQWTATPDERKGGRGRVAVTMTPEEKRVAGEPQETGEEEEEGESFEFDANCFISVFCALSCCGAASMDKCEEKLRTCR